MFNLKSKSTNSINNDNIHPSLIKTKDSKSAVYLEKVSRRASTERLSIGSNDKIQSIKPFNGSIDSIDSMESQERRDSAISDITEMDSKDNLVLPNDYDEKLINKFNKYSINYKTDAEQESEKPNEDDQNNDPSTACVDNPVNATTFLAQFNSKLKNFNEKIFIINNENLLELLSYYYSSNNKLDDNLFPFLHGLKNSRQRIFFNDQFQNMNNDKFDMTQFSHLDVAHNPSLNQLHLMFLNSVDSEDLKLNNSLDFSEFIDSINQYEDSLSNNKYDDDLNNRNFKDQISIYSKISHFVIYNNSNNLTSNLNKALELKTDNHIYIVNFNCKLWSSIPAQYLNESNFEKVSQLPINSINNQVFNCKLLKWEQNLLWKFNSMKWFNKNICLGNLIDYNYLSNVNHNFKLIINCNEYGKIPKTINTYTEFPSSGYMNFDYLNLADIINFVNLLKTIKSLVDNDEQIFIFSFDGFTGLTLLTLAIGLMIEDCNLEDLILSIYKTNEIKLYFFKDDLIFLKKFEKFINYSKKQDGLVKFINYNELEQTKLSNEYDWFNFNKDNNFPCKIYKSLYLGSLNHASSKTILNCMKINKIVSIGELPSWVDLSNQTPIFKHSNGQSDDIRIYDIKINDPNMPNLQSLLFIENIKDDGKDSIFPLLTKLPNHIQLKYLQNPNQSIKTLYHCKIGVSRSASLVIASLMKFQKLSLIESYMIVRINRFNIIIQPNLKIFYDLYLFENYLNEIRNNSRRYTWYHLCNEVYKLNRNYIE